MCPAQPLAILQFSEALYFQSLARTGCRGSMGSLRHQLIQGVWWWISVRDEKRNFLLIHRFLPLFEPTENLFLHYQTMSVMKQAQRHWEIEAGYPFSPALFFSLPSEHNLCPASSWMWGMQYKVNHAQVSYCLPTHLQSGKGKALFLKTAQKHRISHQPSPASVLSTAGDPLRGRD